MLEFKYHLRRYPIPDGWRVCPDGGFLGHHTLNNDAILIEREYPDEHGKAHRNSDCRVNADDKEPS